MIWIQSLNRKPSKMKKGTQIQFPRGKWRETEERNNKEKKLRPNLYLKSGKHIFFFKPEENEEKMLQFLFFTFENKFLELIFPID